MKTKLLLLLSIFLGLHVFSQQYSAPQPKTWDIDLADTGGWKHFTNSVFEFNGDCMLIKVITQALNVNTDQFENSILQELTYENNNQKITAIHSVWDGNDWVESEKFVNIYNGDTIDNTTSYIMENNVWKENEKIFNTFNGFMHPSEIITYRWDDGNDTWKEYKKQEFVNYNNTIYFEYENVYLWNGNSWDTSYKNTFTFSPADLIETEVNEDWENGTFVKDFLIEFTYDSDDFLIEKLFKDWDNSQYVIKTREVITNNTDGHPTANITQGYVAPTVWTNISRARRTYPTCSSLSISEFNDASISIYPNPVEKEIHITSKTQLFDFYLFDVKGRIVKKGEFEKNGNSINISTFKKGLYFLNLKTESGSASFKIIKN
ncbi:T9SS type A sorting domain-containing protein [Hyunsoonleella sp. SJ7]|uniref:T9SS type A sorting domain-containing protein n=1 Tax=Hyunsoonleella aquatilis TaxID=2762758 RepID=A0A923KKM3_9FLAO|nr:T9SS type A sorting domain-containing protein [Hyunsoonleella aquatilis]MBC3756980.1 T9SS type A sorting domain-containing protein [Hyunsoonleella aquatilis]